MLFCTWISTYCRILIGNNHVIQSLNYHCLIALSCKVPLNPSHLLLHIWWYVEHMSFGFRRVSNADENTAQVWRQHTAHQPWQLHLCKKVPSYKPIQSSIHTSTEMPLYDSVAILKPCFKLPLSAFCLTCLLCLHWPFPFVHSPRPPRSSVSEGELLVVIQPPQLCWGCDSPADPVLCHYGWQVPNIGVFATSMSILRICLRWFADALVCDNKKSVFFYVMHAILIVLFIIYCKILHW